MDITAQVEAQDRLQSFTDAMLDPQVLIEAVRDSGGGVVDFVYREVNSAAGDYLGVGIDDLIGRTLRETFPNLEGSGLLALYADGLHTGKPVVLDDFPYFNEILDSARRYDIRAARAAADTLRLTWRDVTERAEQHAAIEQAHQLLRAASDSMLDPQAVAEAIRNPAGEVVDLILRDFNNVFAEYLGITRDELINRSLLAFLPASSVSLLAHYAKCAVTGEPVVIDDFPILNEVLGQNRRYDIRAGQVLPGLIVITFRDTTERFESAERLADSEERYRLLLVNSSDAIVHVRDGAAVWVSPAIGEVLGAPPDRWTGTPIRDVIPPEDIPAFEQRWATIEAGGEVQQRIRVVSVDGVTHWVHLHAKPFYDAGGRRDGVSAALRLIDDEVAAEAELAEARARQAESDAQFRLLMEASDVGMALADANGRFEWANAELCRQLGYDMATLLTKNWRDITPVRYLEADEQKIEDLIAGRIDTYRVTKEHVRADGSLMWVDLSATCLRDADGGVRSLLGQIVDITDEVHAREQLAAAEECYRLMTQNASDAITHIRDGKFLWVSPAIHDVLGAPPEHWIGRDVSEIIPPEDIAAYRERLAILDAGGSIRQRIRLIAVDGITHWVDVHSTPFFDADGRRDGFTGTLRVVDEQVAAEAELAEARSRQAAADALHRRSMETAAVGMCLASPEGPLLEVNQAFCDFFGYDAETMLTKTWLELTAPEYQDADLANVADMVAGRIESYQMDKQFLHADGHRIWGHLAVGCLRNPDGSVAMAIGQIVDITEGVHSRERLATSEENYRLIADNIADVVIHASGGRFRWVSPSIESLLGAPANYWVGREMREIVPPPDRSDFDDRIAALEAGASFRRRSQVISVDGTMHWIQLNARPFYNADGSRDGFIAVWRPIDDEVQAENEATEARRQRFRAEALYRRTVDSAAVGMCQTEPGGRFVEVNRALCEFFGYDPDTLKQKTWQDITAPEYLQADLDHVEDMLAGRLDTYRTLKQFLHADGHRIWGDLSASCTRDDSGHVQRLIAQIVDVTETVETNARNAELNRRLGDDLRSAAGYMASIMPDVLTGAVSVSSRYLPSRELGGDCFDYAWIDDDHLMVYLIDVSGHGIEPALLAVSVQNVLRSGTFSTEVLRDPSALLEHLNRMFPTEHQADHFFTIWYGIYERSTRTICYASAGSTPGYAFSPGTEGVVTAVPLIADGPPVGVVAEAGFPASSYAVPPGCRILLFSDGASEVPLAEGIHMSLGTFEKLATRVAGSPDWSLDDLINELRGVAPDGVFEDDVSLIRLAFD